MMDCLLYLKSLFIPKFIMWEYFISIKHLNLYFDYKEKDIYHQHSMKCISIQKIPNHQGHLSFLQLFLNFFASIIIDLMFNSLLISFFYYYIKYFTNY